MTQEISKEKAKYLKRMAKKSIPNAQLAARRKNQRDAQRVQQAAIAALPKESAPFKFSYSEKDLAHIAKKKAQAMLPMRAQAALAAAQAAEPAPHVHTAACNHEPVLEAQDAGSTVTLDTNTEFAPEILEEAMEKAQT